MAPVEEVSQVIVASDVCLFREGLTVVLSADGRLQVSARARSGQELLQSIEANVPSLVLLDMGMTQACTTARTIGLRWPDIKIIALCVTECADEITECAEAGVAGFVSREGTVEDLMATVTSAERGELACSGRVAALLLQRVNRLTAKAPARPVVDQLTPRERQVAGLVAEGLSNKQIAHRLNITISTTKNHVHHLLEKLGASHRAEAAAVFRRRTNAGQIPL